jgi:SAM-dependent methyltransferase
MEFQLMRFARQVNGLLLTFGLDLMKMLRALLGLPAFVRDFRQFRLQGRRSQGAFAFGSLFPCLDDRFQQSGSAAGHYFHHDLLVARRVFESAPDRHVDVGSRIDGFVAHVAAFRSVEVIDIRPQQTEIQNIEFIQADFSKPLPERLRGYCDSVSSLSAIEHFGLGRYGDPVDVNAYLTGIDNLHRLLKVGGKLYFSVPIGPQRVEFNAHRVFSMAYLLQLLEKGFEVDRCSYIDDRGDLHLDIVLTDEAVRENLGCRFGAVVLELTKKDLL